ncbi:MAG: restriction endonuclease subunit S [Paludibacteraceae bacterium]|nr:restriction endonuclease subunit S [Paludibacteraceae bacterium]
MREYWKYLPLGEICDFISGFTPSKQELNEKAGIPYFKVSDMNRDTNSVYMIETELFVVHPRKTIPANSIIFPKNGGAIFTGKKRILKYDSIIDLNTEALNIKDKNVNLQFLYKFLLGVDFGQFDNGGGLPSINIKKMKDFIVPVPPLTEQERIVALLDDQFAKIDALKANADQQLKSAKDLFQSALKEYLTPKDGWEMKSLEELATDMYRGSGITREQIRENGISCVRYGEIYTTYNYWFDKCASHTDESLIKSPKFFEHGDILFTITGESVEDIAKSVAYLGDEKCLAGGDIVVMKHKQNAKYLSYALSTPDAIRQKGLGKTKLKVVHSNVPSIKAIVVPIPDLEIQQQIADILDTLSDKVARLQANYDQTITLCNDLKQSLLKSIFA